jgi:hypothetical protein
MMQRNMLEERLRETAWPEPGSDLRDRVLAAAVPRVRPSATWADRMWFSRRWRLAAVVLVLALVLLDRIPVVPGSPSPDVPGFAAAETARAADEAARQAGLSPEQAAALARRALIAASQPAPEEGTLGLWPSALGLGPYAESPTPKAESRQGSPQGVRR